MKKIVKILKAISDYLSFQGWMLMAAEAGSAKLQKAYEQQAYKI